MANNKKLQKMLEQPFTHINQIYDCFENCCDEDDVNEVLDAVPAKFGSMWVDFLADNNFLITNVYSDGDDIITDETSFDYCRYTEDEEEEVA